MGKLIIMRGFPASGKTTKATEMVEQASDVFMVSPDDIRRMLATSKRHWHEMNERSSDGERSKSEKVVVDMAHHAVVRLLSEFPERTVVYDAQNVRPDDIESLVMDTKDLDVDVEIMDCTATLDELLMRNSLRPEDDRVPQGYIRRQYRRWSEAFSIPAGHFSPGKMTLLDRMIGNPNVTVKKVKGEDDLYACNFTRDAFTNHRWDDYSSKARGLFLDHEGNVVMRGFDKFFNIGENEETSLENVMKRMTYPARVERKENGFLGIIGAKGDGNPSFRFFSKSGNTDYSQLVRRQFEKVVPPGSNVEVLIFTLMRSANVSLVCEVIDKESDRHIIEYQESCIYALHLIRNDVDFETLPVWDETLRGIAPNLKWPESSMADNQDELEKAIENARKSEREGIVIYGADGYMCKLKSDHYLFIKSLRTPLQNAILRGRPSKDDGSVRYRVVTDILKNSDKTKLVYQRKAFGKDDIDMTYVSDYLESKGVHDSDDAKVIY